MFLKHIYSALRGNGGGDRLSNRPTKHPPSPISPQSTHTCYNNTSLVIITFPTQELLYFEFVNIHAYCEYFETVLFWTATYSKLVKHQRSLFTFCNCVLVLLNLHLVVQVNKYCYFIKHLNFYKYWI